MDSYEPTALHEFIRGVAGALKYTAFDGCFADGKELVSDLGESRKLYKEGSTISRAKAMVELAKAAKEVVSTLEQCSAAITDVEAYGKLVMNLKDPRFYTLHNAFTLALNVAEDRNMLASIMDDFDSGRDYDAGQTMVVTVLDVLDRPGIPDSNGSAAIQIAVGITEGFVGHFDIKCFSDVNIEIKSLVGGTMRLLTHLDIGGLESVFHGIMNIVPTYKRCVADDPAIKNLLKACRDFRNPKELAGLLYQNMVSHAADVTIELTKAVLAFQGHEWRHLGEAVGTILSKIAIQTTTVLV
jgi:hypothetical protein